MIKIKIANLTVGIDNRFDYIESHTQDYISEEEPLFTVSVSDGEIEEERALSATAYKDGYYESIVAYRKIAEKLMSYGVKERVIIHMPDVGVCLSKHGLTVLPSLDLPKGFIKGTTGAGDAFCAGALIGIYEDESDENILRRASLAATAALSETDAIGGMKDEKTIEKLYGNIRRKEICSLI